MACLSKAPRHGKTHHADAQYSHLHGHSQKADE